MQPIAIKDISSLHIYEVNDVLINSDRTLKLAAAFENPAIVSHPGGHFTPNSWPNTVIRQFLTEQPKRSIATAAVLPSFQSLNTFEEKSEATVSCHLKRKTFPIVPIEEQNIDNIIANLED